MQSEAQSTFGCTGGLSQANSKFDFGALCRLDSIEILIRMRSKKSLKETNNEPIITIKPAKLMVK